MSSKEVSQEWSKAGFTWAHPSLQARTRRPEDLTPPPLPWPAPTWGCGPELEDTLSNLHTPWLSPTGVTPSPPPTHTQNSS